MVKVRVVLWFGKWFRYLSCLVGWRAFGARAARGLDALYMVHGCTDVGYAC